MDKQNAVIVGDLVVRRSRVTNRQTTCHNEQLRVTGEGGCLQGQCTTVKVMVYQCLERIKKPK